MRKEKYLKKSGMDQKELGQENRGKEKKEEVTQQKVSKGERYPDERSRPYLGRKVRL